MIISLLESRMRREDEGTALCGEGGCDDIAVDPAIKCCCLIVRVEAEVSVHM